VLVHGVGLTLIPVAVALGCATHIAGDMLTDSGCPLLLPLSQYRFKWWPEPLAFTTGTMPEVAIVDPVLLVALAGLIGWVVAPGAELHVWHAATGG